MIQRYLVPLILVAAMFAVTCSCQSSQVSRSGILQAGAYQSWTAERRAIRNTPLMQRPNRPGHFIGNTLRGRGR